jgi:hypothetical protein
MAARFQRYQIKMPPALPKALVARRGFEPILSHFPDLVKYVIELTSVKGFAWFVLAAVEN